MSGRPGDPGAQTGAGEDPDPFPHYFPVGSYPGTNGPRGLLDTSGGASEWTERVIVPDDPDRERIVRGSGTSQFPFYVFEDEMDYVRRERDNYHGFRVGSVVPAPGAGIVIAMAALAGGARRRRMDGSALGDRCARS